MKEGELTETPILQCADGAVISVSLARIEDGLTANRMDVLGLKEEVRGMKDQMKANNGAVNDLKLDAAVRDGALAEKDKWEARQAANMKWLFSAGLAAAGTLSALTFGILQALAK